MKTLLGTKAGRISALIFICIMGFVLHRVLDRRHARRPATSPAMVTRSAAPGVAAIAPVPASAPDPAGGLSSAARTAFDHAAYLDQFTDLDHRSRDDRDRHGNTITRRANAGTPAGAGRATEIEAPPPTLPALPTRTGLRLTGRPREATPASDVPTVEPAPAFAPAHGGPEIEPAEAPVAAGPRRFNPYGSVIKCELVFTLDSTNEQTPLVAVVMEPVYNNGLLVIPAGTELHGSARPDRLRDRIFSGQDWVFVFPREGDRPNGRQLDVRGVALERLEPDGNGMTWGITDGSYGLEGQVIRTMQEDEIRRFAATFLAAAAEILESRQNSRGERDVVRNTPQNALLQGLAVNLQQVAQGISEEIATHGVFIRVPAGHQFYFYPMQIIEPDHADLPPAKLSSK